MFFNKNNLVMFKNQNELLNEKFLPKTKKQTKHFTSWIYILRIRMIGNAVYLAGVD